MNAKDELTSQRLAYSVVPGPGHCWQLAASPWLHARPSAAPQQQSSRDSRNCSAAEHCCEATENLEWVSSC